MNLIDDLSSVVILAVLVWAVCMTPHAPFPRWFAFVGVGFFVLGAALTYRITA